MDQVMSRCETPVSYYFILIFNKSELPTCRSPLLALPGYASCLDRLPPPPAIHVERKGAVYQKARYARLREAAAEKKGWSSKKNSKGIDLPTSSMGSMLSISGDIPCFTVIHHVLCNAMRTIIECGYEGLGEVHMCGHSQDVFFCIHWGCMYFGLDPRVIAG